MSGAKDLSQARQALEILRRQRNEIFEPKRDLLQQVVKMHEAIEKRLEDYLNLLEEVGAFQDYPELQRVLDSVKMLIDASDLLGRSVSPLFLEHRLERGKQSHFNPQQSFYGVKTTFLPIFRFLMREEHTRPQSMRAALEELYEDYLPEKTYGRGRGKKAKYIDEIGNPREQFLEDFSSNFQRFVIAYHVNAGNESLPKGYDGISKRILSIVRNLPDNIESIERFVYDIWKIPRPNENT